MAENYEIQEEGRHGRDSNSGLPDSGGHTFNRLVLPPVPPRRLDFRTGRRVSPAPGSQVLAQRARSGALSPPARPPSGASRLPAPTPAHPQLFCALLGPADAVSLAAAAQLRAGGAHQPSLRAAEPAQRLPVLRAERPRLGAWPGCRSWSRPRPGTYPGCRSRPRPRALRGHSPAPVRRCALHLSQVAAGQGVPDPAPGPRRARPRAATALPPAQLLLLGGRPLSTLDPTPAHIPPASAVYVYLIFCCCCC